VIYSQHHGRIIEAAQQTAVSCAAGSRRERAGHRHGTTAEIAPRLGTRQRRQLHGVVRQPGPAYRTGWGRRIPHAPARGARPIRARDRRRHAAAAHGPDGSGTTLPPAAERLAFSCAAGSRVERTERRHDEQPANCVRLTLVGLHEPRPGAKPRGLRELRLAAKPEPFAG
jgi:hypothetical protein